MKNKISIDEYKPYEGFYDLREFKLSKRLFRRLWKIQETLYEMTKKQAYYKRWHPSQWEKAKELSAHYQSLLFEHPLLPEHTDKQAQIFKDSTFG